MDKLQKIGGVAAFLEAAIYVLAFVFYGAILGHPADSSAIQKFAFLRENQTVLSIMNLIGYVLFGLVLAALVLALDERFKKSSPMLSRAAAVFGFLWVGLVIASGMIANIGLASVVKLSATNLEQAQTAWVAITSVVEGLGGGNEIVGGLWVLLLSRAALEGAALPKALGYYGILVGIAGVITVFPAEIFTEIFGLSQIVWFIWLGSVMLRKDQQDLQFKG